MIIKLDRIPDSTTGRALVLRVKRYESDTVLVYRHKGRIRAFFNRCPHQGTPLDLLPEGAVFTADCSQLICVTHGATFDPESGEGTNGICEGAGADALSI